MTRLLVLALFIALILVACTANPAPSSTMTPGPTTPSTIPLNPTFTAATTPSSTPTATNAEASPDISTRPSAVFIDGTFRVPDDIAPGTYRTITFTTECYWTRLRGFESGLADVISSRIGAGFQVVTIGSRDAGFDSVGCGSWTDELVPVLPSKVEFGEGTYILGVDVDPGEYVAAEARSCSWERLSGFGGTRGQRIERGFASDGEPPTVTISDEDAGFSSSGCGTWRQVDD